MDKPFHYSELFYNAVIDYLQGRWDRSLNEHERNILIEGYRFGRLVEMKNEIKIVDNMWIKENENVR